MHEEEDTALALLRSAGHLRRYRPRATIFARGAPGDALGIVEAGVVRISVFSPEGRELALALLTPGATIGEVAVLDGGTRTADAIAAGQVTLTLVARSEVRRLVSERPEVARFFIGLLCRRLRGANRQAEGHALGSLPERLAIQLLNLAAPGDGPLRIDAPPSQAELARLVGGARESVNRQMKAWTQAGLIETGGGALAIPDPVALQERSVETKEAR